MIRLVLILLVIVSGCVSVPNHVAQESGPETTSRPVSVASTSGPATAVDASSSNRNQVSQGQAGINYTVIGGASSLLLSLILIFMVANKRYDTVNDLSRDRLSRLQLVVLAYAIRPDPVLLIEIVALAKCDRCQ